MPTQLSEATIAECQSRFNLTYHVPFAYQCQRMVGFEGKDVLEVGGSLPKGFVLDYLKAKSWSGVESPDYEEFLQDVEGTPHDGSVIHQLADISKLGFHNRDLTDYNLFFAYIEDLPPEHYGKYDLIFSLSAFEHIQRFPKALEKMYLALKPSGQLFSMFSPIWSAHDGHHLPNVVDQQGREFNFYKNNPIPPWGHLLMRPAELCRYLYQITDKEAADQIVYYVYNSPQINRFFTEDYIEFFRQSDFIIKCTECTFNTTPSSEIQNTLEKLYPGRSSFANNGLLVVLEKGDRPSQQATVNEKKPMAVPASSQPNSIGTATPASINESQPHSSDNNMETQLYTRNFYDSLHEGSRQSARAIVPMVMELIQPRSVLDVGCGTGNWLSVFNEFGVEDYLGIDGDYVDLNDLQIPKQHFIPHDLKEPLPLDRTFDLVMTVEVAEHLPAELAEPFVKSLARLSPVVLFSAAIPHQGGTGHINEQWLEYWVEIFQRQGYTAVDCLRDKIWGKEQVKPWYAQNLLIFIQTDRLPNYPKLLAELSTAPKQILSKVHPWIYLNSLAMQQRAMSQATVNNSSINDNPLGVTTLIQQYHEQSDAKALDNLRQFRQQLAHFWLNAIDSCLEDLYRSDVCRAYQSLLNSGIRCQPLTLSEQAFFDQMLEGFDGKLATPQSLKTFLALMLYSRAYDLPLKLDLISVLPWFLKAYLSCLFECPQMFQTVGEVDQYYQHIKRWVDYLHANIMQNAESPYWQQVAQIFTAKANFMPLYFSQQNLREINRKRAELIEFTLTNDGHELDYEFPERAADRHKIRLGVLKNHFNPQTETFLTIPAFEYLDHSQFEIILYATRGNLHPMEQYCEAHADKLVYLPPNLSDQVDLIRADDLDVLIFGTNVTIEVNDICWLVAHRLARLQATLYSSPVTPALRHVDYYISGDLTEPPVAAQDHYAEQLITLQGTGYCFYYGDEPKPTKSNLTREALGIPENATVYISGANFFKIIPEVRETWTKILAAVPNSVLVLYPFSLSWSLNYAREAFLNSFYALFDHYGIAHDRLIILDAMPIRADVKEHLKLADIYLDSFPYTGSFSTSDPLEVHLPPVVMSGATLRSRQGSALLRDLQLPELIATTEAEYIQIAVGLGNNLDLLQQKRDQIQQKMQENPRFFDRQDYSTQISTVCQQLFQAYQINQVEANYRLRSINLVALPDWNQPEEDLLQSLTDLLRSILTHPDRSEVTLLISINQLDQEIADEVVGSVIMQLLTEEDLEVSGEEPEISLVGNLSLAKWQMLLPYLSARVSLEYEDAGMIAQLQEAMTITGKSEFPIYEL